MRKHFLILAAGVLMLSSCKELLCEKGIYPFCEEENPAPPTTGSFTAKALGNGGEEQSIFVVADKGYVGLGADFQPMFGNKDFHSYSPSTDSWAQIADLPGQGRIGALAFSIGNFGYAGGGRNGNPDDNAATYLYLKGFWQYNPQTNTWITKKDLPERGISTGFAVCNKGYALKDSKFWEYNPTNNTWTALPDAPVASGKAFTIGNSGYILAGTKLWEYNGLTHQWTAKADSPTSPGVVFSTASNGYAVDDYFLYEYNPNSNSWLKKIETPNIQEANEDGYGLRLGYAFGLNGKGYISIEYRGQPKYFYEYDPKGGSPL